MSMKPPQVGITSRNKESRGYFSKNRPGSGLSLSVLDLAAIRKLLESESGGSVCPSCNMPFDKGKKRKLIDTCGHERCYGCMFRNEACPLCTAGENGVPMKKGLGIPNSLRGPAKTMRQDQQDPSRLPRPSRSSADSCGPPPSVMTQSK
ncbi:uncharacterized protein LOC113465698 [Diaphorina citri]|uniref:Uncharacterized protein LOC113465698 n=1 Tax=Diaphorina citri TaxID=121845 RepID=A0A3Q0INL0_DIACI|nr:uncharacterized protein LOC113465698 [Diaphorina citri]